jgi:hypothetical protein
MWALQKEGLNLHELAVNHIWIWGPSMHFPNPNKDTPKSHPALGTTLPMTCFQEQMPDSQLWTASRSQKTGITTNRKEVSDDQLVLYTKNP